MTSGVTAPPVWASSNHSHVEGRSASPRHSTNTPKSDEAFESEFSALVKDKSDNTPKQHVACDDKTAPSKPAQPAAILPRPYHPDLQQVGEHDQSTAKPAAPTKAGWERPRDLCASQIEVDSPVLPAKLKTKPEPEAAALKAAPLLPVIAQATPLPVPACEAVNETRRAESSSQVIAPSGSEASPVTNNAVPAPIAGVLAIALTIGGQNKTAPRDGETHSGTGREPSSSPSFSGEGAFGQNTTQEGTGKAESAQTSPSTAAAQLEHASEIERLRSESVRGVHVQVESATNSKLDIRMFERAGQLSVTMRSTDPAVTRALQDHSSELTTHLALEDYRSELWLPSAASSSHNSFSDPNQTWYGGQSSGGDNAHGQRQKKNDSPDWVDELERTPLTRKVTKQL